MEDTYLVEIRLARTKWRIREIIRSAASALRLEPFMEQHPHITLFGPLILNEGKSPEDLLTAIATIARGRGPVPFMINGWEMRRGMHGSVIAFAVTPSSDLKDLTRSLSAALGSVSTSLNAWDNEPDAKWFHVTVANRLGEVEAQDCYDRILQGKRNPSRKPAAMDSISARLRRLFRVLRFWTSPRFPPILFDGEALRITVMQNQEILAEYDLMEDCWIHADHSHDSRVWQDTLEKYRLLRGFELTSPVRRGPDDIFFIADLHLGHANIIRYCSRPFVFSDCGGMDAVLIRNWNLTAGKDARIYHIGDLRYGKGAPATERYLEQLSGQVTYISGNHDETRHGWIRNTVIEYRNRKFFLVHDPGEVPGGFDGWIIHGHYHNNDLSRFPFMDFVARRINVSAEVVGYVPVGIREIEDRIRVHESGGSTEPVLLRYPYISPEKNSSSWRQPEQPLS